MTGDTTVPKLSRIEVIETGARRRWTLEEKLRIIEESGRGSRLVSATARRHGLSANQLFAWRRLYRQGRLGGEDAAGFVRAIVSPRADRASRPDTPHAGHIEIVLSEPRRLIVEGDVDAGQVARILATLAGPFG